MQIIEDLKTKILDNNQIFGQNGFFFKNIYEFKEAGISDRLINQFYFRYSKNGVTKFRVKNVHPINTVTSSVRFVCQITTKLDQQKVLHSLLAQITDGCEDNVTIDFYSDDTDEIFRTEKGVDAVIRDFHLISIDLTVSEETVFSDCEDFCLNC
jgi:hypothetical protein